MKILHVLNSRIYSGAEKVVCQIIHSFADDPNVQMVYCSPDSDIVREMLCEQGVKFLPVSKLTPRELKRIIEQEKPDLIHAHDMRASFVASLCCGGIPLISHIHNNAYDARGISPKSIAYLLAGYKAKHIFWVSNSSYEGYTFHKLFAKKSSVLYNIIDAEQISAKKNQDVNSYAFDLIYVGRLTYQKNPQRLMELSAVIKSQKPDLQVAIVGTGELEEETKQLCRELGLEEHVHFLGFQSNPMKMVHDSKVMVLTSRWEGTPMCALEAMALGTPVVSTPSDGMKDLIINDVTGYLCEEDAQLAENILSIITEPDLRSRLSENGKKRFQEINDPDAYKCVLEACYHRALETV